MQRALILTCVLLLSVVCHSDRSTSQAPPALITRVHADPVVLDPRLPLRVEALGPPVRSARSWTTALVPNARGGWNFVTQLLELGSDTPPEYVVVDLVTGTSSVTDAREHRFANSNFQVRNQLRATNGRVFFPMSAMGLAYYDPTDETVKDLPAVMSPSGPDKIIYSAQFGPDGMLYGGTQSSGLPTIVQIDPDKLTSRVIGHVGRDRKTYSYAYQIAVDPPWIYATVGEVPWELAALNMRTGESKILATRTDRPWMSLETHPEGVRAQLITGVHTSQAVNDYVWCVDGKTIPVDASGKLPFKVRRFAQPAKPPLAPEVDLAQINPDPDGIGRVRWRPSGSEDWKVVDYKVKYTMPIKIEALTALPDGSVLGNTKNYHGFFKTRASSSMFLGGPTPSQSKFALLDGTLYITGYPNSVLYAYDPKQPWTGTTPEKASAPGANPRILGNFAQAGAKYAYVLTPSQNRLYFAGRLERDGFGAGVGYYEPATKKFVGHHDNLLGVAPAGLAALPAPNRIVLSERVHKDRPDDNVSQAELVVYDNELVETDRLVVKPGLSSTGAIFPSGVKGVIVGVLPTAVYRYDVVAKKLLEWRELSDKLGAIAVRPADGSLWGGLGASLVRIDPLTLDTVTFGKPGSMPADIENLVWQGDDLYGSSGADLFRITRVGLH